MAASNEDEEGEPEEEAALFIKPTILNPETRVRLPTMNTFARSVQRLSDRTGLTPGQLGIARVFDTPHHNPHATVPLQGMDVLVKDLHQVEGEVTTMGSVHQQFTAPHYDSAAYALLEAGERVRQVSTDLEVAMHERDALVVRAYRTGAYTQQRLAEIAGITRGRVSQVVGQ